MNLKTFLSEALKDIPTHNKIYHRTNLVNLYLILKDGILKPKYYHSNTYSGEKDELNQKEIATGRKSTFTHLDKNDLSKDQLSPKIGSVEFEIYKDRIKTIRNIKVKPIAELPMESKKWMIETLDSIYGNREIQRKVLNQMIDDYRRKVFDEDNFEEYAADYLDLNKDTDFNEYDLKVLKKHFFLYQKFLHKRESEERIQTNIGIPLMPDYMKIKILPSFSNEKVFIKDVYGLIISHKDLFIRDKSYKDLLNFLKERKKLNSH